MAFNPTHIFFDPGNRCQVADASNAPVMWVQRVERGAQEPGFPRGKLLGVICCWFNQAGGKESDLFNTKDLRKLSGAALKAALAATALPQEPATV